MFGADWWIPQEWLVWLIISHWCKTWADRQREQRWCVLDCDNVGFLPFVEWNLNCLHLDHQRPCRWRMHCVKDTEFSPTAMRLRSTILGWVWTLETERHHEAMYSTKSVWKTTCCVFKGKCVEAYFWTLEMNTNGNTDKQIKKLLVHLLGPSRASWPWDTTITARKSFNMDPEYFSYNTSWKHC